MAEESKVVSGEDVSVETTDRGLFDFMGKKEETKPNEEVIADELEKVHVSEPEEVKVEKEENKKEGILEKLHRSSSSSSSSSDEEEETEGGEKKKKKKCLKEKVKEKISGEEKVNESDTSVPIEKYEETASNPPPPEEKKGFIEKIKEKMPGHNKKPEEVPPPAPAVVVEDGEQKKGILEKIKEKLPGYHPKANEEEKDKESH